VQTGSVQICLVTSGMALAWSNLVLFKTVVDLLCQNRYLSFMKKIKVFFIYICKIKINTGYFYFTKFLLI